LEVRAQALHCTDEMTTEVASVRGNDCDEPFRDAVTVAI